MLSLTTPITRNDIHRIKVYKAGKVYLLQGNGEDIVVKQEVGVITGNERKAFDLSKKAMGTVDKHVKSSKKMTEKEIQALVEYVVHQKALVQFQFKDRIPAAAADLDLAIINLKDPSQRDLWYKMPNLSMVGLEDALASQIGKSKDSKDINQDSAPLREFLKTLKAPKGLESLGQIIAVDCFNGNKDRIVPGGSTLKLSFGSRNYNFKAIQNIGNLCLVGPGKAKTLTGMDFADPNSAMKAIDLSLDEQREYYGDNMNLKSNEGPTVFIDYITDPGKRQKFAADIISDLEDIFSTGRKNSWKDRLPGDKSSLGSNATKRLEKGMIQGAHIVGKAITQKISQGKKYPPSFTQRAQLFASL